MRLFLNLVRFCEKLLPFTLPALFAERWVYTFGHRVVCSRAPLALHASQLANQVELSNRYPLLSGFYRLLTVEMLICDKVGYYVCSRARRAFAVALTR